MSHQKQIGLPLGDLFDALDAVRNAPLPDLEDVACVPDIGDLEDAMADLEDYDASLEDDGSTALLDGLVERLREKVDALKAEIETLGQDLRRELECFSDATKAVGDADALADTIGDAWHEQLIDEWARLRVLPPASGPAPTGVTPPTRTEPPDYFQRQAMIERAPCSKCEAARFAAAGYTVAGAPRRHAAGCPKSRARRRP